MHQQHNAPLHRCRHSWWIESHCCSEMLLFPLFCSSQLMVTWWCSFLQTTINKEKCGDHADWSADVACIGRIWGRNFWQYFLPFFSFFFFFNFHFIPKFTESVYHTFFSLCIAKNAQTHLEAPKSISDDSSTVKAWHSRAPRFICTVTLQLPPPPTHVGIRCTDCWIQLYFDFTNDLLELEEIALDCLLHGTTGTMQSKAVGDGWFMNLSFHMNVPNLQLGPQ